MGAVAEAVRVAFADAIAFPRKVGAMCALQLVQLFPFIALQMTFFLLLRRRLSSLIKEVQRLKLFGYCTYLFYVVVPVSQSRLF